MKLTTNQINKLKGQTFLNCCNNEDYYKNLKGETFLNCWSGGGLFKKMCINKLKKDYLDLSIKMIYKKINNERTSNE